MDNVSAYENKYKQGYGVVVPDGHVVRIYNRVVRHEFGMNEGKVLDFGMGVGTHLAWLQSQGNWQVYGCDISETAIKKAKEMMPESAANFYVTPPNPNLPELFHEKFDLIISNQVLYYLDDADLENIVDQFFDLLRPGGIFYASMMPPSSRYFKFSEPVAGSALRKVTLQGRLNETTYINFKTREQIVELFSKFKKVQVGYYETLIREDEGIARHNTFVGTKP